MGDLESFRMLVSSGDSLTAIADSFHLLVSRGNRFPLQSMVIYTINGFLQAGSVKTPLQITRSRIGKERFFQKNNQKVIFYRFSA
jgi:hypothetical protein